MTQAANPTPSTILPRGTLRPTSVWPQILSQASCSSSVSSSDLFGPRDSTADCTAANLEAVSNFLQGLFIIPSGTPQLWCNDKWLIKLKQMDAAFNSDSSKKLITIKQDGSLAYIKIQDVSVYERHL
jgi:hypothetical protein